MISIVFYILELKPIKLIGKYYLLIIFYCDIMLMLKRFKACRKEGDKMSTEYVYKSTKKIEEILNAITHGVGTLLAVIGLVAMLYYGYDKGILHLTSIIVYGVSMILLYLASTLYHSFSFCSQKVQSVFKCIDHSAIYLLIAGNYTPFALIALYGTLGWAVFGVVWGLALAGIVFQIFFYNRFRVIGTICYLVMGWLAVTIVNPLLDTLSVEAIWWLVAGGVLYSIGAIFYLIRKIPYNHVIWHVFVILGSAAHFITIYCYVLPLSIG